MASAQDVQFQKSLMIGWDQTGVDGKYGRASPKVSPTRAARTQGELNKESLDSQAKCLSCLDPWAFCSKVESRKARLVCIACLAMRPWHQLTPCMIQRESALRGRAHPALHALHCLSNPISARPHKSKTKVGLFCTAKQPAECLAMFQPPLSLTTFTFHIHTSSVGKG
jgi:hypothetical protein